MVIRYLLPSGEQKEYELSDKPITLGRSHDVDVFIADGLASRTHCGISFWDNAYFIRDFKSRNGTFVNDQRIEVARLNPGDRIRIGDTVLTAEGQPRKGTETVVREVRTEMDKGKGYHTLLHEIIDDEQ